MHCQLIVEIKIHTECIYVSYVHRVCSGVIKKEKEKNNKKKKLVHGINWCDGWKLHYSKTLVHQTFPTLQ